MVSRKLIAAVLACMVCLQVEAMKRAASESSEQQPNKRQNTGITRRPVHDLIEDGDFLGIEEYLTNGGDSNALGRDGYSALLSMIYSDDFSADQKVKLLRMFKEHGADINAISPTNGNTALACVANNIEELSVAKELIRLGADICAQDFEGWTPLHTASLHDGNEDMVRLLCEAGADVDACNDEYNTPLHLGAEFVGISNLLVLYGADPSCLNADDQIPYEASLDRQENESLKSRYSVRKKIVMPALVPALAPITLKLEDRKKTNIADSLFKRQAIGFRITGNRLALENQELMAVLHTD